MIDEATFMDEVEAMERALYRVSRSLLKSPEDCADAVQEALARAWARRGRVEADYFRPWLMRIVINECHTIGRKRQRVVLVDEVEQPAPAFEPPDERLKQALSAVPEKLKVPLLLHYLEGFSVAEVAQILRIPQGTVRRLLAYARGGWGRLALAGCGTSEKERKSMGKIVGLLIARPGRGGKKGGRKDAGAAQTKAGAGGK